MSWYDSIEDRLSFSGIGLILGAISGLFYAFSGLFVRLLNDSYNSVQITWVKALSQGTSGLILILCQSQMRNSFSIEWIEWMLLVLLAVMSACVSVSMNYSFQTIPLPDAIVLISSCSIYSLVFRVVSSRRICTLFELTTLFAAIAGEILCLQPNFIFNAHKSMFGNDSNGYMAALLTGLLMTGIWMIVHHLENVPFLIIVFVPCAIMASMFTLYMYIRGYQFLVVDLSQLLYCLGFSFSSVIALFTSFLALKVDNEFMMSIGRTFDVVISFLIEIFIFRRVPNMLSISGAILLTCSIVVPSIMKIIESRYT